jgi:hypothetical protein
VPQVRTDRHSSFVKKATLMLQSITRPIAIGIWFALLLLIAAVSEVVGMPITAAASSLWVAACVVPPAIMLLVWRGAPPQTVAEVLHSVDNQA